MNKSIVGRAVESRDPKIAEAALREYDAAIQQASDASERAVFLLGEAVLYGVFLRFDELGDLLW